MADVASHASFEERGSGNYGIPVVAEGESNFKPPAVRAVLGTKAVQKGRLEPTGPYSKPLLVLLINYSQVYFALHEDLLRPFRAVQNNCRSLFAPLILNIKRNSRLFNPKYHCLFHEFATYLFTCNCICNIRT